MDCAPPAITNVRAEAITGSAADVKWTTNEPSTTFMTWGLVKPPANAPASNPTMVTAHSVHLSNLPECARVYYTVGSTDSLSQTSVANNGGQFFSFDVGTEIPTWFVSPNVPQTLPDSNPFPQSIGFTLDDARTIVDVNVRLNLSHTSVGQLVVNLKHPDGSTVFLSNHRGGIGDNFTNTVFDDEAAATIASGIAPFTGSYRPDSVLSILDGKPVQGVWSLEILDNVSGAAATITGFEIQITLSAPCGPPEIGQLAWSDKSSLSWSADAAATTYTIYRGGLEDLPALLTPALDSCAVGTTGGSSMSGLADPPAGELDWFLVIGSSGTVSGQAGSASSGPRILDSSGTCP
jgi:subtilisin-like proprotein convertase family protein